MESCGTHHTCSSSSSICVVGEESQIAKGKRELVMIMPMAGANHQSPPSSVLMRGEVLILLSLLVVLLQSFAWSSVVARQSAVQSVRR